MTYWLPDFEILAGMNLFEEVPDYHGVHVELYESIRDNIDREMQWYSSLIRKFDRPIVAELGCGTGSLSLLLAPACSKYVAVDSSRDMIAALRHKITNNSHVATIEVRQEDMREFATRHNSIFDVVLIPYNGLAHLTGRSAHKSFFANLRKMLKPRGILAIDLWIPISRPRKQRGYWTTAKDSQGTWLIYSQETYPRFGRRIVNMMLIPIITGYRPVLTRFEEHVFTRTEIKKLIRQAGFRIQVLPKSHPMINGSRERFTLIGETYASGS